MKKSLFNILPFALAAGTFASCSDASILGISGSKAPVETSASDVSKKDCDTREIEYYPMSGAFTAKVFTPGNFHTYDKIESEATDKWFGLFKNDKGYYVAETNVKLNRVYPKACESFGYEGEDWNISSDNQDSTMFVLTGQEMKSLNIETALSQSTPIRPGDSIKIDYMGTQYEIYATSEILKVQEKMAWFEFGNYKLYMSATIDGTKRTSLLVAHPQYQEGMVSLSLAGDIDGDKMLDLVIDSRTNYSVAEPTIYLSIPATKGELVKPIGGHANSGC
jgi:hypothetical protein